jgi:hypothetical protein
MTNELTQEYLLECFNHNEEGDLIWKDRPLHHFKDNKAKNLFKNSLKSDLVGNLDRQGYVTTKIKGETYRLNKLIYFMYNNYMPTKDKYIIHLNGNRSDNRIENLKLVDKENNIEIDKTGVYYYKRLNKFSSFVDRGKVRTLIDYYDTEEEAIEAREKANNNKKNNNAIELPTQQYLVECFKYIPDSGELYWKERPLHHFNGDVTKQKYFNNNFANTLVNSRDEKNYILAPINRKYLKAHRLIWKLYYGEDPKFFIDHINGVSDDNRICNLQDIPNTENQRKFTKLNVNNKTGYIGVSKQNDKYASNIREGGEYCEHLGLYDTPEEAALVRELRAREVYGEEFYNRYYSGKIEELSEKVKNLSKIQVKLDNVTGLSNVILHRKTGKYYGKFEHKGTTYTTTYFNLAEEAYDAVCAKKKELGILKIRYQ